MTKARADAAPTYAADERVVCSHSFSDSKKFRGGSSGAELLACHTEPKVRQNGTVKTMSADQRQARTVQARVTSEHGREQTIKRATSKVKAKSSIDFVRAIRGG